MPTVSDRLTVARSIIGEAAHRAMAHFIARDSLPLEQKSASDFVSEADRDVETLIRARLQHCLPGDRMLGEEMGGDVSDSFWAIDPIDGTANFLRGSPLWGVSLGYVEAGRPVVGVVAYPALSLTLSAADGLGIQKNGAAFHRHISFPEIRLASVGESTQWPAEEMAQTELALRRDGWGITEYRCATIGLGFAALGFTDGYVERHTSIWDIAAGAVLCSEAGLVVQQSGTTETAAMTILAATPPLAILLRPLVELPQVAD